MKAKCPLCGSPAQILFKLVCSTESCRNYDATWAKQVNEQPRYVHKTISKYSEFLGGYELDGIYYDLYYSISPFDDTEWVEARYGDDIECYECDELLFAPLSEQPELVEAANRYETKRLAAASD